MKVLLTGATGHIGANVARQLLAERHEVVALVRETSSREPIAGLGLETVVGDLLDPVGLGPACAGRDAVIHCAAEFAIWASDPSAILRPSVEGTENLLRAAAREGVGRVVMTSSAAAVGASDSPEEIRSEKDWLEAPSVPYYRAKVESERLARRVSEELGLATVFLLPTLVLGPHDYRITPSMRPVLEVANGKQPTVDGGLNVVSVRDVARAHVLALERGQPGERYLIGGDNLSLKDLGAMLAAFTGVVPKHMSLPRWAVRLVATAMEGVSALTKKPPPLTRALVDDAFGKYAWIDRSKAAAAFGFEPMSAQAVVEDTLRWFHDRQLLEPKVAAAVAGRLAKLAA